MRGPFLAISILFVLSGCDTTADSDHVPEPVVEAYLVAGEGLPTIRLTTTESIDRLYDTTGLGIDGADVRVEKVDPNGEVEWSVPYGPLSGSAGVYAPLEIRRVEPLATYRLDARLPDGGRVTSSTLVPGAFELLKRNLDEVVYQGEDQFELELSPSSYPGRSPIYVITIEGLDPRPERLTPFYLDAIYDIGRGDPYDPDTLDLEELEDFVQVSSPPLNEANYRRPGEATVTTQLPWFTVVFYGPTRIRISAIDDQLYDFLRFQNAQQGGSTLSPGEIPNIVDSVEGGTGVFASYTPVTAVVEIIEPDS